VKGCGALLLGRAALTEHQAKECAKAIIPCTLLSAKCELRLPRERLNDHLNTGGASHMPLLMAFMIEQARTIADQSNAIAALQASHESMSKELKDLKSSGLTKTVSLGSVAQSFIANSTASNSSSHHVAGTAAIFNGRHILMAGGEVGSKATETTHLYDINAKTWTPMPPMPMPRRFAISASMPTPTHGPEFFVAGMTSFTSSLTSSSDG
jgi:hypothetical protein